MAARRSCFLSLFACFSAEQIKKRMAGSRKKNPVVVRSHICALRGLSINRKAASERTYILPYMGIFNKDSQGRSCKEV